MGRSGGSNVPSTLPPPPKPTVQYDPATSAAENALAAQAKQSYASTVATDEENKEKAKLGAPAAPANTSSTQAQPKRRRTDPGSMMSVGSMGASAVLTG